ncbi:MAG TPA: DUF411 domain-containing protein [Gemmatimonadaceae bacterium]|nr:DUF411 domain-containing protein [Gemmatimonadaceae bacterium]
MNPNAWKGLAAGIAIGAVAAGAVIFMRTNTLNEQRDAMAQARAAEASLPTTVATVDPNAPTVTVYKTSVCGCCKLWVAYLQENGYNVVTKDISDDQLTAFNKAQGLPMQLESCHTALIDGYLIEGHVPVKDIKKLLAERPPIAGLAVPGMVAGTPGMPGASPQPYDVIAFDKQGRTSVYSKN